MTQYVYIASPNRLPTGSFGMNPLSPEQPNRFHSELDFTHLYFENNYDSDIKARFSYSTHFSYKHQVATNSNHIPLKHQIRGTAEEEKSLHLLYSYLNEAIQVNYVIEYFTCINGEEDKNLSSKKQVIWKNIADPYDLVMEDREFWEIFLC